MKRFILLLCFGLNFSAMAQSPQPQLQFDIAKEKAALGDYQSSISLLRQLLDNYPENEEYALYLGRVYSWNQDFPSAIAVLEPLINQPHPNPEAREVMVSVQLWAGNYEEAIRAADNALDGEKWEFYQLQKTKAYIGLGEDKQALKVLEALLSENPDNEDALYLQSEIFRKKPQHLSLSYLNTSFSQPGSPPRHLASLEYKRNLGSVPVLARLNYGHLHGQNGGLFEVDAYPKISQRSYLFINVGAALDSPIFPKFRAGLEYFLGLGHGLGASLGSKYLQFEADNIVIFTGELSYHTSNNLRWTYRPYLSQAENSWNLSHGIALKVINPLRERFWQFDLQYGSVPYTAYTSQDFRNLNTFRAGVQYQFRIGGKLLVQPVFMYEYEEYQPSNFRNGFHTQLITTLRF